MRIDRHGTPAACIRPRARRPSTAVSSAPVGDARRPAPAGASPSGFSLIELLIVLTLLVLVAALGMPALQQLFVRSKLVGAAQEVATHVLRSRLEAMKMARPVVVVPDYDALGLVSFIDENDDLTFDEGADDELYRLFVPGDSGRGGLFFMGPNGAAGTAMAPAESVEGLTPVGGSNLRVIVFEPDGSVRHPGALRISDDRSPDRNVLEVRVAPQATARVEVRKYVYADDVYRAYGAGLWEWY